MSIKLGLLASSQQQASPLLLDLYPGADAAYSLRKLRTAYTGGAIRVRRSSDNSEIDIGFNGSNELDTTALTTFVGSGNGKVIIWYDQSGNANNAITIPGLTQPPDIIISGILQTQNSKPTIRFNGVTAHSFNIINPILADTNISIFMTAKGDSLSSYGPSISGSSGPPTCIFGWVDTSGVGYGGALNGSNNFVTATSNWAKTNFLIYNIIVNSSNYFLYQNNNTFTQSISAAGFSNQSFNRIGVYFAFYTTGVFSELIFYKSNQASNRTNIVNNTNSFYSIF